jgi:hypothetical protein
VRRFAELQLTRYLTVLLQERVKAREQLAVLERNGHISRLMAAAQCHVPRERREEKAVRRPMPQEFKRHGSHRSLACAENVFELKLPIQEGYAAQLTARARAVALDAGDGRPMLRQAGQP